MRNRCASGKISERKRIPITAMRLMAIGEKSDVGWCALVPAVNGGAFRSHHMRQRGGDRQKNFYRRKNGWHKWREEGARMCNSDTKWTVCIRIAKRRLMRVVFGRLVVQKGSYRIGDTVNVGSGDVCLKKEGQCQEKYESAARQPRATNCPTGNSPCQRRAVSILRQREH